MLLEIILGVAGEKATIYLAVYFYNWSSVSYSFDSKVLNFENEISFFLLARSYNLSCRRKEILVDKK